MCGKRQEIIRIRFLPHIFLPAKRWPSQLLADVARTVTLRFRGRTVWGQCVLHGHCHHTRKVGVSSQDLYHLV